MKKIAIIGIGIMGNGIALNFLKNGYEVYVWNRNKEKLSNLVNSGAKILETPKQGAELADIVFEVTANDESSRSVWTAPDGILAGAKKDSVLIICATLSIKWIDELVELCKEKNLTFFDMPMTGSRPGAETGKLVLLAGGDEQKLEKLKPTLSAIAEKVVHFGKAGSGARFKLFLNMLAAINVVSFNEIMKMAKANGMNLTTVGETLAERSGGTAKMAWKGYQNPPNPINFSVKWIKKDLQYAKEFFGTESFSLLNETLKTFSEAVEKGMADEDWTAVNKQ